MKLIFIYGPPAVGKTTVGGELAHHTGFRFFYNHLTVPAAKAIFPDHHEPILNEGYSKLLKQMRLAGIEAAARENFDTIFTLAYSGLVDDVFIDKIVQTVESFGGVVYFVQLQAPDEVLLSRVSNESRKAIAKISDPERLRALLESRTMHESVKYNNLLKLNTAELSPLEASHKIVSYFEL